MTMLRVMYDRVGCEDRNAETLSSMMTVDEERELHAAFPKDGEYYTCYKMHGPYVADGEVVIVSCATAAELADTIDAAYACHGIKHGMLAWVVW